MRELERDLSHEAGEPTGAVSLPALAVIGAGRVGGAVGQTAPDLLPLYEALAEATRRVAGRRLEARA
jgi:hypothetical protein